MEQYIPKSALVAEIERLITPENGYSMDKLLDFIDTIEVKNVNSNDDFIEKACDWFRRIDYDDNIPPFETTEEFIEGFKKAMKL